MPLDGEAAVPAAVVDVPHVSERDRPVNNRLLIFANQYAGALSRLRGEKTLEQYAREAGLQAQVVFTRNARHLRRLLRERVAANDDRVAVAGGDGTVHIAVQELAGTNVALGILPQGTANNFATALRLPRDLPSALRVIADGETRLVDLGDASGEYFTEGAGVGLFANLLASTGGHHGLGHIVRGLGVIFKLLITAQPQRLALVLDGELRVEDALSVTVANSFMVGYNLPIAPGARLTDGELDVVIVRALTRREMPVYYQAIRRRTHLELPKVTVLKAREITISARHPAVIHVDDRVSRRTPVTIRVVPGALRVMVARA